MSAIAWMPWRWRPRTIARNSVGCWISPRINRCATCRTLITAAPPDSHRYSISSTPAFAVSLPRTAKRTRLIGKGNKFARPELRGPGDQRAQLISHLGLALIRQRGNEADRKHAVDDHRLRGADVLIGKARLVQLTEQLAAERFAPLAGVKARHLALVRTHQLAQRRHPGHRFVTHVPHQAQPATGPEHP